MANWDNLNSEGNIEDRRGMAPIMGGIGIAGAVIITIFTLLSGGNLNDVLNTLGEVASVQDQRTITSTDFDGKDDYEIFASKVLGSNNDMWENIFAQNGLNYSEPTLVLFRTATSSACGGATSDVGPHYCPADQTIYLDETFFDELTKRFGARGGDVAEAYVISHEVGHHAQNLLGTMDRVGNSQSSSINLELQADCYSGLWANSIRDQNIFEPGEIEEAIDAAAAVGDDRIQKSVEGRVDPESWTHGSSEQRMRWFNTGYNQGRFNACNTFR